jgi:hypothetical protein
MPTNTYVALDKITVSGTSTTSISFTSIPATYTDLVLVFNGYTNAQAGCFLRFNNDTTSNYSDTRLLGSGSSAASDRDTSVTGILAFVSTSTTNGINEIIQIQNYSNTTTFKTALLRWNNASSYVAALVGLWRKTPEAINRIDMTLSTSYFVAGSTFSLYGIASSGAGAKATGGTVYSDSQYFYHVFNASGTFTPTQSITADVLVVAGGGGGGTSARSGGGGAGGLLAYSSQSLTAIGYTCTIGSGGAAAAAPGGTTGNNSQFGSLTASTGGGGGGTENNAGKTGGSGGGGGGGASAGAGGGATSGQGFAGGAGYAPGSDQQGGGGGGAGAVGQAGLGAGTGDPQTGGAGGIGATSAFINAIGAATGAGQLVSGNYYFAGGGGGHFAGSGGAGGGGGTTNTALIAGFANTGGGGKGGGSSLAAAGGSGIVIVRYAK